MVALVVAVAGGVIGAGLARRNEKRAHADRLLADALDDLVGAIADVAAGDQDALRRYAAATSRLVLHGSSTLVEAFRLFQVEPTTGTTDGRRRLIAALQAARRELGRPNIDEEAASMLLFGHADDNRPQEQQT